jgi:IS605 OrfB family transposase
MKKEQSKQLTTFKIKIRTNPAQNEILDKVLQAANIAYNWCLWLVLEKSLRPVRQDLQKFVSKKNCDGIPEDMLYPPLRNSHLQDLLPGTTTMRQYALDEFSAAWKKAKTKQGTVHYKPIENICRGSITTSKTFINKLSPAQVQSLDKKDRNFAYCYFSFIPNMFKGDLKEDKLFRFTCAQSAKKLPPFDHAVTFAKTNMGKWHLYIPCAPQYTRKTTFDRDVGDKYKPAVLGIDPGVRTFQTVYDNTTDTVVEYGAGHETDFVTKLKAKHFKLRSRRDKTNSTQSRDELTRAINKIEVKINNMVHHLHREFVSDCVKSSKHIALGNLGVKSVVSRAKRRQLAKYNKTKLHTLSHYKCKKMLQNRVMGTDTTLYLVDEKYTSKMCSECKAMNDPGHSKTYACGKCGVIMDRDVNGARNILYKSLEL